MSKSDQLKNQEEYHHQQYKIDKLEKIVDELTNPEVKQNFLIRAIKFLFRKNRRQYSVTYSFTDKSNSSGYGRMFLTVNFKKIDKAAILLMEEYIRDEHNFQKIFIQNLIRLEDVKGEACN